jgi:hypothetical protein|nr:PEGA domain-containing protein [Kofleriaceae bacterium]
MRIPLVLLILVALATAARADNVEVGVVVTGEPALQPQLVAEIETWFHGHELTVIPGAIDPESINAMIDCFVVEDVGCARKIVDEHAKTAAIVFVRADASPGPGNSRDVTLTGYWFDKGQSNVFDEKRTCEKCTDEKARQVADGLAAALAAAGRHEIGRFHLTSSPAGARVAIDGKPVGATPSDGDLAPGDHEVEVTLGARTVKRMMTIRRGETTSIDVPLPAEAPPPSSRGSHLVPGVVIGGGAVAVVAGIVLVAVNQDPDPHANPQPATLRDTKTGGYVLGGLGVVGVAAGVYLWMHVSADSAPTVALEHGGAIVGWTRSF